MLFLGRILGRGKIRPRKPHPSYFLVKNFAIQILLVQILDSF